MKAASRGRTPIGVKRINGGMKWPFVIRGHKPSMGHPSPFRERGLGVRAKLPVSRTPKLPMCCDCTRGTIRRENALPSPQPSPFRERVVYLRSSFPTQFRRLTPMGRTPSGSPVEHGRRNPTRLLLWILPAPSGRSQRRSFTWSGKPFGALVKLPLGVRALLAVLASALFGWG